MTFLITNNSEIQLDDKFGCKKFNTFNLHFLLESPIFIREFDDYLFIYRGYFGSIDAKNTNNDEIEKRFIKYVDEDRWPLPETWAGSFTFILFNRKENICRIGNDSIGVYPCYYSLQNDAFSISDSLILISKTINDCQLDETGVFQRMISENSNFGNRTIIKNVKSLLPGELLILSFKLKSVVTKYDNALYGALTYNDLRKETLSSVYEKIKFEHDLAVRRYTSFFIGLSGGLDSRLLLGLIDINKVESCLTYGSDDFYETKIAAALAKAYKIPFNNYFELSDLWPSNDELNRIVYFTESATISVWNTILKRIRKDNHKCLLLGDLCESLPGRNIKAFSSRKSRIGRYISSILIKNKVKFTNVTLDSFKLWKSNKIRQFSKMMINSEAFSKVFQNNDRIVKESLLDLEVTLSLINNHEIPYEELFDELFGWYIHARIPMGGQLTIFGEHIEGLCPSMGLMALRCVSRINPSLRIDYHFMNKFIKNFNSYRVGLKIPTAQAPFIPFYFSNSFRLLVWGIRSKIDNYFVKRMIKKKNVNLRYSLLKSINWAALYHEPKAEKIINDYFHNDNFNLKQLSLNHFHNRKKLIEKPLANHDIIRMAALNIEINMILRKQNNLE